MCMYGNMALTKSKEKLSKRERIERGEYTKHPKAEPYARHRDPILDMDEEQKKDYLKALVGDWDSNGE